MALSPEARDSERKRIAQMVLDLVKERGTEISYSVALPVPGLKRFFPITTIFSMRSRKSGLGHICA